MSDEASTAPAPAEPQPVTATETAPEASPTPESTPEPAPTPESPAPSPEPVVDTPVVAAEPVQAAPEAVSEAPVEIAPAPEPLEVPLSTGVSQQQAVIGTSAPTAPAATNHWNDEHRRRAHSIHQKHKEEHLEKIVAFAQTRPYVTNDDIEKLLHVSDATASRYLKMLVAAGKLVKEGKGRGVKYRVV